MKEVKLAHIYTTIQSILFKLLSVFRKLDFENISLI